MAWSALSITVSLGALLAPLILTVSLRPAPESDAVAGDG